ncbi:MAG: thiamine ABC transporter substrate-binding protein [Pelolinea sp.]|nr:thiamine ABC transporter substrate-binding protein [Pelolinea sp.]
MKKTIFIFAAGLLLIAACSQQPNNLIVMTHDSFAISEAIITAFEEENNIKVVFLPSGDAGSILNRAILSKNAPVADILYGIDNTYLSRAIDENLFEVYNAPLLAEIPDEYKLDSKNTAIPIDYGDVCINYQKRFFRENNLDLPTSLKDLTDPKYANLLVVENPATSSPGLAFLLATIAEFGEDGYLEYWNDLKENGIVVVNDWETAYYTNFSGSAGKGAQPMVVSYGTSPAAEVIFSEEELVESPTASLVEKNMCFRQIEFAGILKGTKNRILAEKFIDLMLSAEFQEDIPLNMFVFPANRNAVIPQEFLDNIQLPEVPAVLETDKIAEMRETWIGSWRELMLQ